MIQVARYYVTGTMLLFGRVQRYYAYMGENGHIYRRFKFDKLLIHSKAAADRYLQKLKHDEPGTTGDAKVVRVDALEIIQVMDS